MPVLTDVPLCTAPKDTCIPEIPVLALVSTEAVPHQVTHATVSVTQALSTKMQGDLFPVYAHMQQFGLFFR